MRCVRMCLCKVATINHTRTYQSCFARIINTRSLCRFFTETLEGGTNCHTLLWIITLRIFFGYCELYPLRDTLFW